MEVGPPRLQYTRTNYRSGPGWFPLTSSHPRGKDSHRQSRITGGRVGRFGSHHEVRAVLSGGTLPSTRPAPPLPGEAERVSTDSKILEYVSSVLDVSRRGTVERRSGNPEFVRFVWYGRGYAALEEQRDVERVSKEFVISTRSSSMNCPFTSKNSSQCSLDIRYHSAQLDSAPEKLTSRERKRVYVGLYQCHLPKMDGVGVIEFDKNRGTIESAGGVGVF